MIRPKALRPVRASAQDIGAVCGYAVTLANQYPEGSEWSEDGTAKHAQMEAAFKADVMPSDRDLAHGYVAITKAFPGVVKWETEVACQLIDPETGEKLTPDDTGKADLVGTMPDGTLVIGDFKFGAKAVEHPDHRRQNKVYGASIAIERNAPGFVSFIWQPLVAREPIVSRLFGQDDIWKIVEDARAVAMKDPETPITGSHCSSLCYRRTYCRAWLLPAHDGETALTPFTAPGGLTAENASRALQVVQAMEDAIDVAKARLRDFARENGGIRDGDRVWGPSMTKGKDSGLSVEDLKRMGLEQHIKRGKPSERFDWRKAR